jgi:hypothetical protein
MSGERAAGSRPLLIHAKCSFRPVANFLVSNIKWHGLYKHTHFNRVSGRIAGHVLA